MGDLENVLPAQDASEASVNREEQSKKTSIGVVRVLTGEEREASTLVPLPQTTKVTLCPILKADDHPVPSQETIRSQIILDPRLASLPEEHREAIIQKCLETYQQALASFEHAVAEVAWNNPEANRFANDLCRRLVAIANAYYEVMVEKSHVPDRALMRLMNLSQFFARGSYDSGSVGYNPLSIQKALQGGNLREKMTLADAALFGLVLQKVFSDKEMASLVNQKLALLPKGEFFQIDESYVNQVVDFEKHVYRRSSLITDHRIKEAGRTSLRPTCATPPSTEAEGPRIAEIVEPSIREVRVGLGDYVSEKEFQTMGKELASRRVGWLGGALIYGVDPKSSFARRAIALGGLPVVTGPSGTAEGFFNVARCVRMGDKINEGMLAMAAWLIPARDHSLHEIRMMLPEFGIPYSGMPQDFTGLYNESFSQQVQSKMPGEHLPPYFLGQEYQMTVAHRLGYANKSHRG